MTKILLVEDNTKRASLMLEWLQRERYQSEIADSAHLGLHLMLTHHFDVVVLNLGLAGLSGLDLIVEYRARGGRAPILATTDTKRIEYRVRGLDLGADDCVLLPMDSSEFLARVRALLRRPVQLNDQVLRIGSLSLDTVTCRVAMGGCSIKLSKTEYRLLETFMRYPGRIFSIDMLSDCLWTINSDISTSAIRTYVNRLRRKLQIDGNPSFIDNLHGHGYCLSDSNV